MSCWVALHAATAVFIPACASAQTATAAAARAPEPLPLTRITLYRSGVGFFQRSGSVSADATVSLRFDTDQINDILKTLVVLDPTGGTPGVAYSSKEPLGRRLASFGVDISDNPSIAELLGQLRGSPASITTAEGVVRGTILGVEDREIPAGEDGVVKVPHVTLVAPDGLVTINIREIRALKLDNESLNEELTKALAVLAEYRADRTKVVDLTFRGSGARQVAAAYVHETPVWKTSYRLVLPEAASDKPLLQGWAIVENTTDQDWSGVRLSLVSGRPVSFQMDLYEPLYMPRPEVPVPTIPGVLSRAYDQSVSAGFALAERGDADDKGMAPAPAAGEMLRAKSISARSRGGAPGSGEHAGRDAERAESDAVLGESPMLGRAFLSSAASAAQGQETGEVFEFELTEPLTLERQRSAMVPILADRIEARRVSIYNPADAASHPMRGVELTNSSSLQLLPGPIAVVDGDAYAGDAQVGHIAPGEKRLLAYALDLDVAVISDLRPATLVRKLRIVNGLLEQSVTQVNEESYTFENKDRARPRTIVVESPRLTGFDLVEPKAPVSQTQAFNRFETSIDPAKGGTLKIRQERTELQQLGVLDLSDETLVVYQREGKVSAAVVEAIRKGAALQADIHRIEREINETDREIETIGADQDRVRKNMGSIDRASDLYSRYMKKLGEQETRIESLTAARDQLSADAEAARKRLADYIADLNVD